MRIDRQLVPVIRVHRPLVEKLGGVDHGDVFGSPDKVKDVLLPWERIGSSPEISSTAGTPNSQDWLTGRF